MKPKDPWVKHVRERWVNEIDGKGFKSLEAAAAAEYLPEELIHYREVVLGTVTISQEELRAELPCRCNEGYKIRDMIDPNCVIHDLEKLWFPNVKDKP